MSDNRKYYYLKLKEDFYDREEIKIIESMPNGYKYSNILLKMYLKSLKREGKLMITDCIPYSLETLSAILGHDIDTVRAAVNIFKEFKLVEILNSGEIYMIEIQNFIGKSSTEGDRKRDFRKKISEEKQLSIEGGQMSDIRPPEIEIDIELEKEKEKELEIKLELEIKKEGKSPSANKEFKDVLYAFSNNIHPVTFMEQESLLEWCNQVNPDVVIKAIEQAVYYNKRSYGYINKILFAWKSKNITTIEGVNAELRDFMDRQNKQSQVKENKYGSSKQHSNESESLHENGIGL